MGKVVQLLPAGAFLIHKGDQAIPGRFTMYVWDAFLEEQGLRSILDIDRLVRTGMNLRQCASLIRWALNDYNRIEAKYKSNADVMDLIDEVFPGGAADEQLVRLLQHAIGRIAQLPELPQLDEATDEDDEQKKSE